MFLRIKKTVFCFFFAVVTEVRKDIEVNASILQDHTLKTGYHLTRDRVTHRSGKQQNKLV
jgi:hypothetical protein